MSARRRSRGTLALSGKPALLYSLLLLYCAFLLYSLLLCFFTLFSCAFLLFKVGCDIVYEVSQMFQRNCPAADSEYHELEEVTPEELESIYGGVGKNWGVIKEIPEGVIKVLIPGERTVLKDIPGLIPGIPIGCGWGEFPITTSTTSYEEIYGMEYIK
jgi:hypothetical protein